MGGTNSLTLSPFPLRFPPPLRMASREVEVHVSWVDGIVVRMMEGTNACVDDVVAARVKAATATIDLVDGAILPRVFCLCTVICGDFCNAIRYHKGVR